MPVSSPKAQKELQALYRAYVENLPRKVDEVEHLWSRAVAQPSIDLVVLKGMHLAAHSLSGSGATYGCVALSKAFARLEDLLQPMLGHHHPTPKDRKSVTGLLTVLKALAHAQQDPRAQPGRTYQTVSKTAADTSPHGVAHPCRRISPLPYNRNSPGSSLSPRIKKI